MKESNEKKAVHPTNISMAHVTPPPLLPGHHQTPKSQLSSPGSFKWRQESLRDKGIEESTKLKKKHGRQSFQRRAYSSVLCS